MRTSSSLCSSAASHPSSHTPSGRYCCNPMLIYGRQMVEKCFNTASGKYCCFITFVFPSFQSGTRDVRTSSSLCSSASSHPSSHTASGRYCYFITFIFPSFQSGTRDVRTSSSLYSSAVSHPSSHTASGKHCCNCVHRVYKGKHFCLFQYRKR